MRQPPPPPAAAVVSQSSPINSFILVSNDDHHEQVQARAAAISRTAATTTTTAAFSPPPPLSRDPCLSQDQIMELFQNCVKLATENKINQKNTWELKLIDHLSEIIKAETGGGGGASETNFQKASCTLEAGVKIYSVRVDSVHSEAYKVLGEINRAGVEDEQKAITECENANRKQDESHSKEKSEKKISPLLTLESSFEVLNMKRFNFAFTVDPLYHQTSEKFDEGGVKGLLLNNLGVYGKCRVLFDSFETPGKSESRSQENDFLDSIDISFAKDSFEYMVMNVLEKDEISPTLRDITCHFDEDNRRSSEKFNVDKESDVTADGFDTSETGMENILFGSFETWTCNYDDEANIFEKKLSCNSTLQSHSKDYYPSTSFESDVDQSLENVTMSLFQGLGITSMKNIWVGPDHWKFRKCKSPEDIPVAESGSPLATKRRKNKNQPEVDIDFRMQLDTERVDIFAPPKSLKTVQLPPLANREPCSTTLPEDCHYEPENLVKLFLLPSVLCLEKKRRELLDNILWQQRDVFDEALPSWDNESVVSGQHNDEHSKSEEDADGLVSKPRQVDITEIQYEKTCKRVDVQALKETLWDHIQEFTEALQEKVCEDTVSFKHVLSTFPVDFQATTAEVISPHLCFICLLHLANEHGLSIQDCPSLDDLTIHLPPQWQNADGVA